MNPEEPEQPNPETRPEFNSPQPEDTPPAESAPPSPKETLHAERGEPSLEDRNTAMLAHICGIFASFIVPLVIYLVKKDEEESASFVITEAKEALNFQITLMLASVGLMLLTLVTCGIGALLGIPLMIWAVVMPILAAIQVKDGRPYVYPLTVRLVS
ncbi:MAG: DUF4870 domain-containing protein [Planctomycetota bacterium]